MIRSLFVTVVAAAFIIGLVMTGAIGASLHSTLMAQEKPTTSEVKIDNFSFGPAVLNVPVGTTVTWTNRDDIPHTVVSTDDAKTFKSKVLDTDDKCSTPTTSSRSPSPSPERTRISAPSTRR